MAQAEQCDLLYLDESGFSPNPPLQYGRTSTGHSHCAEAGVHRQRVNGLGALGHDGKLLWTIKEQRTARDNVIAFLVASRNSRIRHRALSYSIMPTSTAAKRWN